MAKTRKVLTLQRKSLGKHKTQYTSNETGRKHLSAVQLTDRDTQKANT